MSALAALLALPFLLWSWIRHDNQEDFEFAIGIMGFLAIVAAGGGIAWWAFA